MMPRSYATPAAFKQALEQRLRSSSTTGADFARRRQLVVFERFLARVSLQLKERVCLKGGLVLELRLERVRTTKDVDLRCIGTPDRMLQELQAAGRLQLGDFMTYEIGPHAQHPDKRPMSAWSRSRLTSPRSFTHTRCPVLDPTRGLRTCQIWLC
jgi:hypothetical protein